MPGAPTPGAPGARGCTRASSRAVTETRRRPRSKPWQNKKADVRSLLRCGPPVATKPSRRKKQYFRRKKLCRFCVDKIDDINYKDTKLLNSFISERGKVTPRRISGVCAPHQRRLAEAIKQARNIALLPFSAPV